MSETVYNALSGTQAVTCDVGPGTYGRSWAVHGFALATDLKQGDVIYLSCHIALKSVTGLMRAGFEPKINGQNAGCWLVNPTGDFDGIITKSYTVSADVPAGTNLLQDSAYIQPFDGKTFTVADGGYARVDHLMMSIGQPAAWAPAEGETVYNLLRSDDILWAGAITGTAQRITLSHAFANQLISSEAFARIFKPGHTYTLSYSGKVIEPAPDTAYREDRFGIILYSPAGGWSKSFDVQEYHDNPPAGYTFHKSKTFTTPDSYPGDVRMLTYSGYSRDESGAAHQGIVEIDDLMIVEGSTPAAWAPAEGETLTADGGGGMTEPTNLVKTQPDENEVQTIARIWSRLDGTAHDSTTDYHIAVTINPDAQIAAEAIGLSIKYTDSSGGLNWPRSASIASAIPANVWTRVEGTVTLPAGMTPYAVSIWRPSVMHFRACNLVVYPLTGGRIVRARGATAGYISKAKEATVLYTPSKSARQVRVILLDETGSSIYDIQSVAIVADAEELQGKVAAQESSIQTIQSDMTTVQSGLSGLNVRLASMQTELAGVSAGDVLYQVPYTVSGGKATFTAAVYKSGVECHTSYDPSCFTWYLKSEAGTVKIGTGYSVTVNVSDVGYGGFIVGVFETQ